jgi:Tfp pilus assembly major pilin PilA
MENKDIFVIIFVLAAVGFSLYRKYVKKNQDVKPLQKPGGTGNTGSSFSSVKDDYEPYSKK